MAINFPDNPSTNDVFIVNGRRYVWDSVKWIGGTPTTQVTISSETAPLSPTINDLWWNTLEGGLYVYYNDGTSSQWVSASPPGTDGTNSVLSVNAPLTYDSVNKIIGMTGTPVMNGGTVPVGFGGVASATAEVAITEVGLANSGSLAGSALDIAQTWNTTGNPTAIKLNVTNSNSGSTSKLMDLQVGGASVFRVMKDNKVRIGADNTNGVTLQSFDAGGTGKLVITDYTSSAYASCVANTFYGASTIGTGFAIFLGSIASPDIFLRSDAANTFAQRNGVNSQTSRIYNTYTDASNYERSSLSFVTYSGALYTKLAAESAGTGSANIGIALSPKGTGAITAQVPDGTTAGGNARGANSVDLQTVRTAATQVASGPSSVVIGWGATASGTRTISLGGGIASNQDSIVIGGTGNAASAATASIFGGSFGLANKATQNARGITNFTTNGDCQYSYLGFAGSTTDATTTEIFLGSLGGTRATIPNSTTWAADIDIVARSTSGTENAYFKRRLVIQKGTTAASTALVGSVELVSTIASTGASTWAVTLSADTTNGALKLEVTGSATNIRWVAKVSLVEVGFA